MIGLLWQRDREDEPLETTLAHACRRYRARFGQWPAVALVADETAPSGIVLTIDGKKRSLDVRHTHRLRRGCVMVGVEGRGRTAAPPPLEISEEAEERPVPPAEEAEPSAGEALPVQAALPAPRRARRNKDDASQPEAPPVPAALPAPAQSQLPGIEPPAPSPVKRRSTMGWAPSPDNASTGKVPGAAEGAEHQRTRSRRVVRGKDIEKD